MFLTLPVELRLNVYEHLFRSTAVRHGFSGSTSNHASIFRTCREICEEVRPFFLPNDEGPIQEVEKRYSAFFEWHLRLLDKAVNSLCGSGRIHSVTNDGLYGGHEPAEEEGGLS